MKVGDLVGLLGYKPGDPIGGETSDRLSSLHDIIPCGLFLSG